jgi:hypothetical protein
VHLVGVWLVIHDSIPVCCVQHQAFRRKIRHIIVSDPARYGLCYGLTHCFHLKTLTVHVGKVDGVFLEKNLMSPKPTGAMHKPKGRRLRLEIEQVEQPRSTMAGMDDQLSPRTDSGRWSGGANGRLEGRDFASCFWVT